jgi:MFS family permease
MRPRTQRADAKSAVWPLQWLNFFMADVQAGIGPFLGIFLMAHGWKSGLIGTVMSIGGVAAMAVTAPAGALVDISTHKRLLVIVPGVFTMIASATVLLSQQFWVVAASQIGTAIAGAAIGPAVNSIPLGIVRQAGFIKQTGMNQAFNHAGNMIGAALSGFLGWKFGFNAVLWLAVLFGLLSIASVMLISPAAIDQHAARGMKSPSGEEEKASGYRVLVECTPLLVLAAALTVFHLGNAAMLPLYGMKVVADGHVNGPGFVAITIVVAQGVMILTSLVAKQLRESQGLWIALLVSFAVLPIRGLVAAFLTTGWAVYPVQFLDGIGAGLQSVVVPVLVARTLNGTGRVNVGLGAVMTAQGIGAALSPAFGGWMAQERGYDVAFLVLGCCAIGPVVAWVVFAPSVKTATTLRA